MFKSRKTGIRRGRESQQFAERGGCKRCKLEGSSNITSNRVTIPLGFLNLGVRSKTVQREPRKGDLDSNRQCILNDNLHGLLQGDSSDTIRRPRRSLRINKLNDSQSNDSISASDYFCRNFNSPKRHTQTKNESKENLQHRKTIVRNNSKSLFQEINERYARAQTAQTTDPTKFDHTIIPVLDSNSKVERFRPTSFCRRLAKEVSVDVRQHNYLLKSKLSIRDHIRDINKRLRGEMTTPDSTSKKRDKSAAKNARLDNFRFIPPSEWVLQTPPRQRVVFPRAEGCAIQPAVICTTRKQSNIYELNPGIQVDLTGYSSGQNVQVDGRYMRHLASFEDKMNVSFNVSNLGVASQCEPEDKSFSFYKKRFKFSETPVAVSHPFAQAVQRPVKTLKKVSRVNALYVSSGEERPGSTPVGANQFSSPGDADITILKKDGEYKFVHKRLPETEKPFNFNFKKNLFSVPGDSQKLFNFKTDDVFDFHMK